MPCKPVHEVWKDIIGHKGSYQVSNLGRIKSLNYKSIININVVKAIIQDINQGISNDQIIRKYCVSKSYINKLRNDPNNYLNKEQILRPGKDKNGYLQLLLCRDSVQKMYKIHRLILEAFVSLRPLGMECRHLNGDRLNNNLYNLVWGTTQENMQDKIKHKVQPVGSDHGMSKLKDKDVLKIRKLLNKKKLTQKEIGELFNVSQVTISCISTNKKWKDVK